MSNFIPFYFKSNQDLLDKLESLRPLVKRTDDEAIAKHKADERRWLQVFRATVRKRCAELLKLDYAAAKAAHGYYHGASIHATDENGQKVEPPNCPVSQVEVLDRAIAMVKRAPERKWRINPSGDYHAIHMALSLGIDKAGAVC